MEISKTVLLKVKCLKEPLDKIEPLKNTTQIKKTRIMDFIELARSRCSCKRFDSRQISKEQLDSILEAGRLAPTAKDLQEQHVLYDGRYESTC